MADSITCGWTAKVAIETAWITTTRRTMPIREMEAAQRMVDQAAKTFERPDIVVNNAGNQAVNTVDLMTAEQWDAVQRIDLRGTFFLIKYAVPVQQHAGVVNTSSEAGIGAPDSAQLLRGQGRDCRPDPRGGVRRTLWYPMQRDLVPRRQW